MESFALGLGKADIQELIKAYPKTKGTVDTNRFKDDLNVFITRNDLRVVLKSILHDAVKERIVEQADLSPRGSKKKSSLEHEGSTKYGPILTDIMCGLFCRGLDAMDWFLRFSSFVKGSLSEREFISALESLNIQNTSDPNLKTAYYNHLLER